MTSNPEPSPLVVGVDFGTVSARAVVVDTTDGRVLGSGVNEYRHVVIAAASDGGIGHLVQEYAETYAVAADLLPGGAVYTSAVDRETLEDFAIIAGVELACIDGDTTVRSYRDHLRWNASWFHLNKGI